MNGLLEILSTKKWMIMPEYVHGSRTMWEQNLNGHIGLEFDKKKKPYAMQLIKSAEDAAPEIKEYQVTEQGKVESRWWMDDMDAPFVNVMPVAGPITREGGACSYGSMDLRDWLMEAANNEFCKAHVFVINSPGGSAWAINDFKQAIEYAHERGQKVYAFVDGLCASAAMYLASVCDEVYYMHPKDLFGSIGVMAVFYTEKNGTTNKYTNETFHELYDPESYDKNKWYRDLADDPKNDKVLIEELKEDGVQFRKDIQAAFPAAKEEHIHGKLFEADKVTGILCDGQMTLGEVITRAFEVANGSAEPITRVKPVAPEDDVPEDDPAPAANANSLTPNNNNSMKEYKNIATACGVEELVQTEEGAHFVPEMLDALDQTLEQHATEKAAAEEKIQTLQGQVDNAQTEREEAVANREKELNEAHEQAIANLNEEHNQAIEKLNTEHTEALQTEKDAREKAEGEAKDLQAKLDEANQIIADQKGQIEAMTAAPAAEKGGSPANNGQGAEAPAAEEGGMPAYDHSKSPKENKEIREAWKKAHQV